MLLFPDYFDKTGHKLTDDLLDKILNALKPWWNISYIKHSKQLHHKLMNIDSLKIENVNDLLDHNIKQLYKMKNLQFNNNSIDATKKLKIEFVRDYYMIFNYNFKDPESFSTAK